MSAYDRPIGIQQRRARRIDAHDPRYAEALVDVRDLAIAGENYYARTDGGNTPDRGNAHEGKIADDDRLRNRRLLHWAMREQGDPAPTTPMNAGTSTTATRCRS